MTEPDPLDETSIIDGLLNDTLAAALHLVVTSGPRQKKILRLGNDPILIGRSPPAVGLGDHAISGRHCLVTVQGQQVFVEDLDSTNGTFIDGERITGRVMLRLGSVMQAGRTFMRLELLQPSEVQRQMALYEELDRAAAYIRSLLPDRITDGPVTTQWSFVPSANLGGDAFGYHYLPDGRFSLYLLDVCGHGAGAALHSVSALNVLRTQSLPRVDFGRPEQVLSALNATFGMDAHGGKYFTIWYGVYEPRERILTYSSGGHPPAFLKVPGETKLRWLHTPNLPIGMMDDAEYGAATTEVPPGSGLYVFSDGTYEVRRPEGEESTLDDFEAVISADPEPGVGEPQRIERTMRAVADAPDFRDDFSLLHACFDG